MSTTINNTNLSLTNWELLENMVRSLTSTDITWIQVTNFFLGLPLNLCVISHIARGGLDGPAVFTLSLAASEILFALCAPLFILCHAKVMNYYLLQVFSFLTSVCITCRLFFPVCVCVERYLAVVHPVTFLKYRSMTYRLAASLVILIFSVIGGILFMMTLFNLPYIITSVLHAVILCLYIFCFFSVLRVLKRPKPGSRVGEDSAPRAAKQKALNVVFCNLLIFLIQIVPVAATVVFERSSFPGDVSVLFSISIDLNICAGLLQPALFFYQTGKLNSMSCVLCRAPV